MTPMRNSFLLNLKRAFLWHWHLLALGTAAGVALLSGHADVAIPLVAGAELAYMGFMANNVRFQKVITGQEMLAQKAAESAEQALARITSFIRVEDQQRFIQLRDRCAALLRLRRRMDEQDGPGITDTLRGESLDRMLWLFLKLLHQKSGLEKFLASTALADIRRSGDESARQLEDSLVRDKAAGTESRLTVSIREKMKAISDRLKNHQQASENHELVCSEIDKTEQQITQLCEAGMTMRDTGELGAQIDALTDTLRMSDKTFADTAFPDLSPESMPPPLISGVLNSKGMGTVEPFRGRVGEYQ